jgi:hypothetical protein
MLTSRQRSPASPCGRWQDDAHASAYPGSAREWPWTNSGSYLEASTGSAWSALCCALLELTPCFHAMRRADAQL